MAAFRTSDLNLAAALKTALQQTPTVQIHGRLAEFTFDVDPQEAQRVTEAYYSDQLNANLRLYAQNLRDLKSLIFAARDGTRTLGPQERG